MKKIFCAQEWKQRQQVHLPCFSSTQKCQPKDQKLGKVRHDLLLRNICFLAVVNIAQITIERGDAQPEASFAREF